MKSQIILTLSALLIIVNCGCNRRIIRIPETQIHVVNEIDSAPVEGIDVSVNLRLAGGKNEQLFSGTTDAAGGVTMPGTTVRGLRGLEMLFQWETAGAQAGVMLVAPPTRFPGNEKPPVFRFAGERSGYVTGEERKFFGDCINLMDINSGIETIQVTFTRPSSFLVCDEIAWTNGDVQQIGRRDINANDYNHLPREEVEQIGGQLLDQLTSVSGLAPIDASLAAVYVEGLLKRLCRASDVKDAALKVVLVDAGFADAIYLPSGTIIVDLGLLRQARNESEAAGILAVQVARFAARQGEEAMTAAAADALAAVHSGQIKLEKLGPAAVDAYLDAGLVQQPGFWPLAWGPAWSEEADILAVQYLWNAGIDPRGLAQLLERLSAGGETDSGLFDAGQTRDELANRVARIRDFAGQFLPPRSDLAADSQAFQQVAQQLPPANVRRPGSGLAEIRKGIVQIAESITRSYVARAVLAAVPAGE